MRSWDIDLSATTSDEISWSSSTQKLNGAISKKEKHIDGLDEISTNLLNEHDKQQSPSYSVKTSEDYINVEAILKSPLISAHEECNDAKIELKVMKENYPNKVIVGHLIINSLRDNFGVLQYVINRNWDIILPLEIKTDDWFPLAQFMLKGYGIAYRLT